MSSVIQMTSPGSATKSAEVCLRCTGARTGHYGAVRIPEQQSVWCQHPFDCNYQGVAILQRFIAIPPNLAEAVQHQCHWDGHSAFYLCQVGKKSLDSGSSRHRHLRCPQFEMTRYAGTD